MPLNYEEIGYNIRNSRVRMRMTQAQLSEATGISTQYLSHIERGRNKVSLEALMKISKALNADLYLLLGENDKTNMYYALTTELDAILKELTTDEQELCVGLCRTVAEQVKNSRKKSGTD